MQWLLGLLFLLLGTQLYLCSPGAAEGDIDDLGNYPLLVLMADASSHYLEERQKEPASASGQWCSHSRAKELEPKLDVCLFIATRAVGDLDTDTVMRDVAQDFCIKRNVALHDWRVAAFLGLLARCMQSSAVEPHSLSAAGASFKRTVLTPNGKWPSALVAPGTDGRTKWQQIVQRTERNTLTTCEKTALSIVASEVSLGMDALDGKLRVDKGPGMEDVVWLFRIAVGVFLTIALALSAWTFLHLRKESEISSGPIPQLGKMPASRSDSMKSTQTISSSRDHPRRRKR